jgi:hypothetical protein
MVRLTPGSRHDGMKFGLVRFKHDPTFHDFLNQLWCIPPLDCDEFEELSLWCESILDSLNNATDTDKDKEKDLSMEKLVQEFTNSFKNHYLFNP